MKRGIIAIYDNDSVYMKQLMEYLNHKKDFIFQTRIFTKSEVLEAFCKKQTVDILLVNEEEEITQFVSFAKKIIILCSGRLVQEKESYDMIYKFQSAEEMMRELLSYYIQEESDMAGYQYLANKKLCSFIGIFSPSGGTRKTTFAFALGQALGVTKKVLYINLELFPGNYKELSYGAASSISELIYYIKQRKPNFYMKLSSLIRKFHNLDYILPPNHYSDLYELEEGDVLILLKQLQENSEYETIIFDIGFISEAMITLMGKCSQIYMPKCRQGIEISKEERFLNYLEAEDKAVILEKIDRVEVPFDEDIDKGIITLEQSPTGVMGQFIHNFIQKINGGEAAECLSQQDNF